MLGVTVKTVSTPLISLIILKGSGGYTCPVLTASVFVVHVVGSLTHNSAQTKCCISTRGRGKSRDNGYKYVL